MIGRIPRIALACLVLGLVAAKQKPLKTPSADEILRRAEDVRSPDLSYAADFKIRVVATGGRVKTHEADYSMIARGKDETLVVIRRPEALYAGLLLIADEKYWMLLPKAGKPFQLAPVQIILGDVASGDIARANLARSFVPRLDGEETLDGTPCYRLELGESHGPAPYTRVVFWVAKGSFLPQRLDYYGQTEKLLRTVRYLEYTKGPLGLRAMRIEIESPQQLENRSTLTFSNLRTLDVSNLSFKPDAMVSLRDELLTKTDSIRAMPPIEELLAPLRP